MSHFSASDWVDSVRGLLPPSQNLTLQSHLDRRCAECLKSFEFWTQLAGCLTQERRYRAPEVLLEAIERLYTREKPWRWVRATARWAELVFDSIRQPSPVFVRGGADQDRHLIYEAEPFVIDVTLKTDKNLNSLSMVGQILKSENPGESESEVHVVLLSGPDLIAKTVASKSGEFALECEAHDDLSLFISVRGERAIGLSLCESPNGENSPAFKP